MARVRFALLVIDLLLTAAIAGFFYAYSSTVMRGLDAAAPETAIAAMQAINANVRNPVFAPSFFGPALIGVLLIAAYGLSRTRAAWFARAGALAYLLGGFALTLRVNVPMNEGLAAITLPTPAAETVWGGYSAPWTLWNAIRTGWSFLSLGLLLAAFAAERSRRA